LSEAENGAGMSLEAVRVVEMGSSWTGAKLGQHNAEEELDSLRERGII
jgi:hypothetical protein